MHNCNVAAPKQHDVPSVGKWYLVDDERLESLREIKFVFSQIIHTNHRFTVLNHHTKTKMKKKLLNYLNHRLPRRLSPK